MGLYSSSKSLLKISTRSPLFFLQVWELNPGPQSGCASGLSLSHRAKPTAEKCELHSHGIRSKCSPLTGQLLRVGATLPPPLPAFPWRLMAVRLQQSLTEPRVCQACYEVSPARVLILAKNVWAETCLTPNPPAGEPARRLAGSKRAHYRGAPRE